jgi:7-cyano-7-deazaguanine synthase
VLIFSGGVDSTVLLSELLSSGVDVYPLSFNYGQKHAEELEHAKKIVEYFKLVDRWKMVDIADLGFQLLFKSSQTSEIPVPHGHYTDESMKATVVPNRNMIMLSLATGYAISIGADSVAYAAHAGDHAIYPDCRPGFVQLMDSLLQNYAYFTPLSLLAPFIRITKTEIVLQGMRTNAPFELTYSCYEGKPWHCGKCGTCVERQEAFLKAGMKDPTVYGPSVTEAAAAAQAPTAEPKAPSIPRTAGQAATPTPKKA